MSDQSVLPDRVKTATKTALATVLAYGVALSMDWEHAYWAAFAVAFCTLSSVGESLNKGLLRLSGTLVGSLAALTLIALFPVRALVDIRSPCQPQPEPASDEASFAAGDELAYFVNIGLGLALGGGAPGEMANVSHTFQPLGRSWLANSP